MKCLPFKTHVLGHDRASLSPRAPYVHDTKSLPLLDPNLPEVAPEQSCHTTQATFGIHIFLNEDPPDRASVRLW